MLVVQLVFFFFERIITPITIYDHFTVKLQTKLGTRANSGRFHFKVGCISAFREKTSVSVTGAERFGSTTTIYSRIEGKIGYFL